MSESSENQMETVIKSAKASVVANDRFAISRGIPVSIGRDGEVRVMKDLLCEVEDRMENPARRKGQSRHTELESFIEHINRNKEERTTIWADVDSCSFSAIYNDHPAGDDPSKAGWGDHGAKYSCPLSPEWQAWLDSAGRDFTQSLFAQWVDERMDDLIEADDCPKPIELLEMARNLQVFTKGVFAKKIDPTTGQYALECKQEHTKESTAIPRKFMTALRIFDGGDQYRVEIRLQFRVRDGQSWFSYSVHRSEELKRDAFGEMRTKIAETTDRPVFAGRSG